MDSPSSGRRGPCHLWADSANAVAALEPSVAFEADHGIILAFLDEHGGQFKRLLDAARAADAPAVFAAREAMRGSYCRAVGELSEQIAPATSVYFDATLDICRG